MKYKTVINEEGQVLGIAMDNKGNPIVIQEGAGENGADKEVGLDAIHLFSKVPALQDESKTHRLKAKGYRDFLDALEEAEVDISDVALFKSWLDEATGAISTVKNLDDKKLIDAKDVETLKKQTIEAHEKKIKELEAGHKKQLEAANITQKGLESTVFDLMVSDKFQSSKFVADKLSMPAKVAKAYFGQNFRVEKDENGKYNVISYHKGEKLYSEERMGEAPDFDEAIGLMVARDPDRDSLIVASSSGGSGAGNSGNGNNMNHGGAANQNPWIKGPYFNLTQQGEIVQSDPERAMRLQVEAKTVNLNNQKPL